MSARGILRKAWNSERFWWCASCFWTGAALGILVSILFVGGAK